MQYYFLTLIPEYDMSEPEVDPNTTTTTTNNTTQNSMSKHTEVALSLPALPEGWSAEKDFKPVGKLSAATQRSIEPVGYVHLEAFYSRLLRGERLPGPQFEKGLRQP